jgi:hypothetical protein
MTTLIDPQIRPEEIQGPAIGGVNPPPVPSLAGPPGLSDYAKQLATSMTPQHRGGAGQGAGMLPGGRAPAAPGALVQSCLL